MNEYKPQLSPPSEVLAALNIKEDSEWDVLIVGDGSGSKYSYPGGWAAIVFDRYTGLRKLIYGSVSDTTVHVSELSPYIYSMMWYSSGPGKSLINDIKKGTAVGVAQRLLKVHILTDCEIVASLGNGAAERYANIPLWRAMDSFGPMGYDISWHHLPRENTAANILCDKLSKDMRKATNAVSIPDIYAV